MFWQNYISLSTQAHRKIRSEKPPSVPITHIGRPVQERVDRFDRKREADFESGRQRPGSKNLYSAPRYTRVTPAQENVVPEKIVTRVTKSAPNWLRRSTFPTVQHLIAFPAKIPFRNIFLGKISPITPVLKL